MAMTSKVEVFAQSHACDVREVPVIDGAEAFRDDLPPFIVPAGESETFYVHSGQSLLVREARVDG
jgi:hypothetical protein